MQKSTRNLVVLVHLLFLLTKSNVTSMSQRFYFGKLCVSNSKSGVKLADGKLINKREMQNKRQERSIMFTDSMFFLCRLFFDFMLFYERFRCLFCAGFYLMIVKIVIYMAAIPFVLNFVCISHSDFEWNRLSFCSSMITLSLLSVHRFLFVTL